MRKTDLTLRPPGTPAPPTVRVTLIEDIREVRESLTVLINGTAGFACTHSYRSMEEALTGIDGSATDVILTDIGLPGMSGVEGTPMLRARFPHVPVLALTIYDDDDNVFNAICAGASGYLLKNTPPARLLESLREVAGGGAPMSPEIARRVLGLFRRFRPPERHPVNLTPQELTLLKLMVEGHHYKTAATEMQISINTVSFHLRHIYEKLQVHSKTEAVARALREGLI